MDPKEPPKHPATRRYIDAEKEQAVRLVRQLRKELGIDQGTVGRVARQLGYGEKSVRSWIKPGRNRPRGEAGHYVRPESR